MDLVSAIHRTFFSDLSSAKALRQLAGVRQVSRTVVLSARSLLRAVAVFSRLRLRPFSARESAFLLKRDKFTIRRVIARPYPDRRRGMVGQHPEHGAPGPDFSLIFPAYNAVGCVAATWDALQQFLPNAPGVWEFLFVCDGCTDDTVERLRALMKSHSAANVRLLSYDSNRGKGYAVRRGLLEARGRWRIFTDVDLAYRFDSIMRVAEVLRSGADVAIASRLHPDSRLVVPPLLQGYAYRRYLQSLIFSAVVRQLLPLPQRDTQAGLKGLSARAVQRLLPGLHCNGFGFDCELLSVCQKHRIPVVEVPVTVNFDNRASTTSWRSMHHMLGEIWAIRRRLAEVDPQPSAADASNRQAA
jgi:hypothetical protein